MDYNINSSPTSFNKLYEEQPERWNHKLFVGDIVLRLVLEQFIKGKVGLRLIDLGCAPGRTIKWIGTLYKPSEIERIGVDFSPIGLELARENNPDVRFILCDMTATPFEDKSFDIVLGIGSFEHLYHRTFAEPRRLVKDDGLFLCQLPLVSKRLGWREETGLWEWKLSEEDWVDEISSYGFKVEVQWDYIFICYPIKE